MAYDSTRFTSLQVPTLNEWNQIHDNTDALKDGTGFDAGVLQTNPYCFSVSLTVAQSGAVSGSTTVVEFDSIDVDVNSDWNATNDEYVVPVSGIYLLTFHGRVDAAGGEVRAFIYKDATDILMTFYNFSDNVSDDLSAGGSVVASLTAGQTIEARALHIAGSNRSILSGSSTVLSGHLIHAT